MRVAKTKALISFAVTAKLICAFVLAYANCWSSHVAAQIIQMKYLLKRDHVCTRMKLGLVQSPAYNIDNVYFYGLEFLSGVMDWSIGVEP